jgi:hypothetical protein
MMVPVMLALGLQLAAAAAENVPVLNVEPVCRGIAQNGGQTVRDKTIAEQKETCIKSELSMRDQLAKQWATFVAADKAHCVNLTKTGGESSYTELLTCLEMARDVRIMRSKPADALGVPKR